jgi:hypothetical protein
MVKPIIFSKIFRIEEDHELLDHDIDLDNVQYHRTSYGYR